VKSKVKENQVQDQDQIETAKIHWSKKKRNRAGEKKKWNPNGMLGGKVLTGLWVKAKKAKSQAEDLTRCLVNS